MLAGLAESSRLCAPRVLRDLVRRLWLFFERPFAPARASAVRWIADIESSVVDRAAVPRAVERQRARRRASRPPGSTGLLYTLAVVQTVTSNAAPSSNNCLQQQCAQCHFNCYHT